MTILGTLVAALFPAVAWRVENSYSNHNVASDAPTMAPPMLTLAPPIAPVIEPAFEFPEPVSRALFSAIPPTPALALRAFVEDLFDYTDTGAEILFPNVRRDYEIFVGHGWPPASDRALGSALMAAGFRKRVTCRNDEGKRPTAYIAPEKLRRAKKHKTTKPKTKKGRR